jgi:hypothetical protein
MNIIDTFPFPGVIKGELSINEATIQDWYQEGYMKMKVRTSVRMVQQERMVGTSLVL